jgi:hypothetical protein
VKHHVTLDCDDEDDVEDVETPPLPPSMSNAKNDDIVHFESTAPRAMKRNHRGNYETKLLLEIREKFHFGTTPDTPANRACIHKYAVKLMIDKNLRLTDRRRILMFIVDRYFVPTADDLLGHHYSSSYNALAQKKRLTGIAVDYWWQKYLRVGRRPGPEVTSA